VAGVRSDGVARQVTDPYSVGETTITWTARDQEADENGQYPALTRSASCQQKITVTSNDAPTISCPIDKSFAATSGQCERTLTGAEIGTPTTTGTGVDVSARRSDNRDMSDPFSAGQTVITWTATDSSDRVVSCTQTITITGTGVDNTPPVLTVPGDVEVTTSSCTALVDDELGVPTATDSCGGGVKISRTGVPTGPVVIRRRPPLPPLVVIRETFIFPVGTTIVTYTATDAAGNVTTGTQKVIVREDPAIPPTITAPADVSVNADAGSCSASGVVLGTPTTADNCGVASVTNNAPSSFPVGTTQVTWTVTDKSGNTATDVQNVTVIDNQKPVITAPANVTVYLPLNSTATSMAVNYAAATATDNCPGSITIGYSQLSGTVFPVGTTTVTVTATDAHNNNADPVTFTVTVLYNFTGFFSPVGNLPTLNSVNAGRAIPVKFSLSGNKGLDIFAPNNPHTVALNCGTNDPSTDITETLTAGGSTLQYSPDQYIYVWKTESSWAGTCRQLVVTLNDGSVHRANFKFK
jgi:hypothetical protein